MKRRSVAAAVAAIAVAASVGFATVPASAAVLEDPPVDSIGVREVPDVVIADEATEVMAKLEALRGTQSAEEIEAIANSGKEVELLIDENDQIVAAYIVGFRLSTFAISLRGPGCASGDACATSGGVPNGYFGTGQRDINLTNVTRISAGSHTTTFWGSGGGDFVAAGVSKNFSPGRSYYSITRGS